MDDDLRRLLNNLIDATESNRPDPYAEEKAQNALDEILEELREANKTLTAVYRELTNRD
jgi:hypothetical protein